MLITSATVIAQSFDADSDNFGQLVLPQKTLTGKMHVNSKLNQVLLTQGNNMKIYSARDIKSIIIHNKTSFISHQLNGEYHLLEVLALGHISVFYKTGIEKDDFTHKQYSGFFTEIAGRLREIEKKKDFLELFGDDEKWMSLRIKNQGYNLDDKEDVKAVFQYYNQSFEVANPSP